MSKQYSAAERAAWGRQQDEIRAAGGIAKWRAQQGIAAPTPAKRQSRAKPLIADVSGSDCFNSLVFTGGEVIAQFAKDGSVYAYPMIAHHDAEAIEAKKPKYTFLDAFCASQQQWQKDHP